MLRLILTAVTLATLLAGCATTSPWSDDFRACGRQTAAWNLVPLVGAASATSAREACMNERGWMIGGEGYRRPAPGEPTPAELIAEACAKEKRFGDSVWFQAGWVKCPDANPR